MNQPTREWIFWAAVAICVAGEAAIIFSSVRSLRRGDAKKARKLFSETVWAILPAIALAWLLVATWSEVRRAGAHEHMTMPMPTAQS
jgi:heme/copper-type cytochrome/quinol oxidase subunit 2